ncbi:hypothetical protein PHISP_05440 [Aspergillus sp. HF37]|nr:hypothetical protein PHISP_05440 [Aspergillus sp. HF37]
MPEFRKGENVRYKPVGGPESKTSEAFGTIQQVSTENTNLTGRNVEASEEEPRYEIANSRTGKKSAIKESNIIGPAD